MLKKLWCILFLILIPILGAGIFLQAAEEEKAEGEEEKEKTKLGFGMNFNLGLSSYEDSTGNQIAYQKFGFFPEFSYGKLGVGLDLTFEFDGDFKLRDLDNDGKADTWSTFPDYLYKVYYVRYGQKGEPIFARVGAFDSYTLGHGLIMDSFTNTLFYPQVRQLGLNLDIDGKLFNFPLIGMESVVDNVLDFDIIGLRVFARPLMGLTTPIINELKVGASLVTDLDTLEINDPTDPDYDKYSSPKDNPDSKDNKVTEVGLDAELPLLKKGNMSVITYMDLAKISGKGSGSLIGTNFTYAWFKAIAQLRFFGKQFAMSYFDPYYENDRATKYASLDQIESFYMGYLIGTDLNLFNTVTFMFYWSDGFNDPYGPRIQSSIATVENVIPKINAAFTFDKKDINSFRDLFSGEDVLMQLRFAYQVSSVASLVLIYQRTYSPSGEPADETFIETQFSF